MSNVLDRQCLACLPDFQPVKMFDKYKKVGVLYSAGVFFLGQATLVTSYTPPIIESIRNIISEKNTTELAHRGMPYYSWIPIKYCTWEKYLAANIYQAGPMFIHCYIIIGMDSLYMNMMNYISYHLDVIKQALLSIRERCVEKLGDVPLKTPDGMYNSKELMDTMHTELRKISNHLKMIFELCDLLDEIQRYPTLALTLCDLFILCTSLFLVSMAPIGSKQFLTEILYLFVIGSQFYFFCLFGNEITTNVGELPLYVWQSDWLESDANYRNALRMIMVRCRKPVFLTAGKFTNLTLATFMSTMKAAYSAYTLLKNTNDK